MDIAPTTPGVTLTRRTVLRLCLGIPLALRAPAAAASIVKSTPRSLSFFNLHTGESLTATY